MLGRKWIPFLILLSLHISLGAGLCFARRYILLVDQSQSLKTNDPLDLRKDALRFLVDQLQPEDSVALYSFGQTVDSYNMQGSMFIRVEGHREWLTQTISSLGRNDNLTDLRAGLQKVLGDLEKEGPKSPITLLIFTDAQLRKGDIPRNLSVSEYLQDVYRFAGDLANRGVTIDGLAFTRGADVSYLRRLASLTNGNAVLATTPEAANQAILKLLSAVIGGPFGVGTTIPIQISEAIESFKVFAFNKNPSATLPNIYLFNPRSKPAKDVETRRYATSVSVEEKYPIPGKWTARVAGAAAVEVFFSEHPRYRLIFHAPEATDLSACQNSEIPFDIELAQSTEKFLSQSTASVKVTNDAGQVLLEQKLKRLGNTFRGTVVPGLGSGTYTAQATVTTPVETAGRSFVLSLYDCPELKFKCKFDSVIGSPVDVSVSKPPELRPSDITVRLLFPSGSTKQYALYDDGSSEHGDALAGDNTFSNILKEFEKPGVYTLEVVCKYKRGGLPVSAKQRILIYKIIQLAHNKLNLTIPRATPWRREERFSLTNRSAFELSINNLGAEQENVKWLSAQLGSGPIVVGPRETKTISLAFEGHGQPPEEASVPMALYMSVRDLQWKQSVESNALIPFVQTFSKEPPLATRLIRWLLLIGAGIIVLVVLGLLIVTPMRFEKKAFRDGLFGECVLSGLGRKIYRTYVTLPSKREIGISLFGYGSWYVAKEGKIEQKGKKRIGLYRVTLED